MSFWDNMSMRMIVVVVMMVVGMRMTAVRGRYASLSLEFLDATRVE